MKKDLVEIIMILDKSGSMSSLRKHTIEGFNEFIEQQKELLKDKEVLFSLITFNQRKSIDIFREKLQNVKSLSYETYTPEGSTALLDTLGYTIDQTGELLFNTLQHERPQKVIIAIITDGQQNSSHVYTNKQIQQRIQHQTDVYSWQFLFLSSDLNAIDDAISMYGINSADTLCFSCDQSGYRGVNSVYNQLSKTLYKSIYTTIEEQKNNPTTQKTIDKQKTTISRAQLT